MASTYLSLHYHLIFGTKNHEPLITPAWRDRLHAYLGGVIRTLDGPLAPLPCASRTAYQPCQDCDDVKSCAVRIAMSKVRDAMAEVLDRMTLADMLVMAAPTRKQPIMYDI